MHLGSLCTRRIGFVIEQTGTHIGTNARRRGRRSRRNSQFEGWLNEGSFVKREASLHASPATTCPPHRFYAFHQELPSFALLSISLTHSHRRREKEKENRRSSDLTHLSIHRSLDLKRKEKPNFQTYELATSHPKSSLSRLLQNARNHSHRVESNSLESKVNLTRWCDDLYPRMWKVSTKRCWQITDGTKLSEGRVGFVSVRIQRAWRNEGEKISHPPQQPGLAASAGAPTVNTRRWLIAHWSFHRGSGIRLGIPHRRTPAPPPNVPSRRPASTNNPPVFNPPA